MMKFYYAKNTCAMGAHILLEEIGADYEAIGIDLSKKEQLTPEYRAVNPKAKVPALVRADGSLLTEYQAMAFWLAETWPEAGLLPADLEGRTRIMEAMDFMVGSIHMRGMTFIIAPMKFTPSPEAQAELTAHGKAQVALGFDRLAETLGDGDWLAGDYSIADSALFYLTQMAMLKDLDMPPSIARHRNRMLERPAVLRALAAEEMASMRA